MASLRGRESKGHSGPERRAQSSSPAAGASSNRRRMVVPDEGAADASASSSDVSNPSTGSATPDEVGAHNTIITISVSERFKELMEDLSSKRGSTREAALASLHKLATNNFMGLSFEGQIETLLDTLKRNLRRGTAAETKTAADMLAMLFLTSIVGDEQLFQQAYVPLEECIRNLRSPEARAACISSLGVCCFTASDDIGSTMTCLNLFEEIFTKPSTHPETTTSALDAWSLIATTISTGTLAASYNRLVKQISKLLQSDNIDLRLASGEALALLLEAVRSEEGLDESVLDESIELLHTLANESSKHRAKKDRSRQRAAFRDILRSVEESEPPSETVKFKRESIMVDSWSTFRRLETMRENLGEGLHIHFKSNPIVRDIFGLPPPSLEPGDDTEKMSSLQKVRDHQMPMRYLFAHHQPVQRLFLSPNSPASKARSRWLTQQRQQKPSATQMLL